MINFGYVDILIVQLINYIIFNIYLVCVLYRLFIFRSDSWYIFSVLFLMFIVGVDIINIFKKFIRIYWLIFIIVYW